VPLARPTANYLVGLPIDGGFQDDIVAKTSVGAVERPTFGVDSSLGQDPSRCGRDPSVQPASGRLALALPRHRNGLKLLHGIPDLK
jgi:hypothetical protein